MTVQAVHSFCLLPSENDTLKSEKRGEKGGVFKSAVYTAERFVNVCITRKISEPQNPQFIIKSVSNKDRVIMARVR